MIALVLAGFVVFLAISAGLARALSAASAERGEVGSLVRDQARGDAAAVVARIDGCARSPACRAQQRLNARTLRRGGTIKILNLDPSTRFSLKGVDGPIRVAWQREGSRRVTVQCVGVRRTGNVISGFTVAVTSVSRPIGREASCPGG
jgi:hypothetical protein